MFYRELTTGFAQTWFWHWMAFGGRTADPTCWEQYELHSSARGSSTTQLPPPGEARKIFSKCFIALVCAHEHLQRQDMSQDFLMLVTSFWSWLLTEYKGSRLTLDMYAWCCLRVFGWLPFPARILHLESLFCSFPQVHWFPRHCTSFLWSVLLVFSQHPSHKWWPTWIVTLI